MESGEPLSITNVTPAAGDLALDPPAAGEFSFVFLPDTQYYCCHYPALFRAQTQWIADQRARYHIAAVLHEGDIVDGNGARQWANADAAIRTLEAAEIPYVITIGNHDYDTIADGERRATGFNGTFPPERYTAQAGWQGAFFEAGHSEN